MTASRMHSSMCFLSCILLVLWVVSLLSVSAVSTLDQMMPPRHNCCHIENTTQGMYKAYCNHCHLKSVPQDLPNRTIALDLSHNFISQLQSNSFGHLWNLINLNLKSNAIVHIENAAFTPLLHLKVLCLSGNKLTQIQPGLLNSSKNLTVVDLGYNLIPSVPLAAIKDLSNLQKLILMKNSIKSFDFQSVSKWRRISDVNLSRNDITSISKHAFSPLQNNSMHALDLRNNKITEVTPGVFSDLTIVHFIYLDANNINKFEVLAFMGNLKIKKLSLIGTSLKEIIPLNKSTCDGVDIPHILNIELSNNGIFDIPQYAFAGFNHTLSLKIRQNRLTMISNTSFCGLHSLEILDISGNQISSLPLAAFHCNENLLQLNISHNQILRLHPGSFVQLSKIQQLDLSYNMLSSWKYLSINVTLIVSVSLALIMVGYVAIVVYYRRWWVRYHLYLLKLAIFGYKDLEGKQHIEDYRDQLNVMFSDGDEDWVNNVMRPAMEEKFPQFESILWGDDYLEIGLYLVDAIHHALENSFKTVLVISNQSVEETWFMTKLRMALEHINDTKLDKVVLIFKENVEENHLPYLVRLFLSANRPYLKWEEDEYGQNLFWAKLEKNFRSNKVINNAIPV
ncbi:uncharacterized protein [Diadema antillarum]|uniref:uncharacterized protein n=1 Tax=Diadema antillarum TaxID=105358 RepID=UPI003A88984C